MSKNNDEKKACDYCSLTCNNYQQLYSMSCGPTACSEMIKRIRGTPLTTQEHDQVVDIAMPLDQGSSGDDRDKFLKTHGSQGYGFEAAINSMLNEKWRVTWVHGNADPYSLTASQAVARSSPTNPAMLVLRLDNGGQHWVTCIGKNEEGEGLFVDPGDGKEWGVPMENVEAGDYQEGFRFKQNGYMSQDP